MSGTNCAIKTRITKKGIDYASSVVHQKLLKELQTVKIGDHSGNDHGAKWEIKSIENKNCGIKHCSIAFSPGDSGLSWSLNGVFLNLEGNWKAAYRKGIIKVKDHGKIEVKVKGLRFEVRIKLEVEGNGRPTMSMANCDVHIHDVDVKFHGGAAFIYNIFSDFCGRVLKKAIRDQLYSVIEKFINKDGPKELRKLKLSVKIDPDFTLNYGLIQVPTVKPDCLDAELKGKVHWKEDVSEAPMVPKAMPSFEDQTKMLYLVWSEHIVNSMVFLGHKNDSFQFNVNLAITSLELNIKTISAPCSTITQEIVTVTISTSVNVKGSGFLSILPLPTVKMDLTLFIQPLIEDEKLKGKLLDQRLQFERFESVLAAIPKVKEGLTNVVVDEVSKTLERGIDLPFKGAVKFIDPSLQLMEGAILIGTDVQVI